VLAVSKPYIHPTAFIRAVSEARAQLDFGTDVQAMVTASGELRDLDPEHPLIAALEARIRRASQISLIAVRAKLAARTGILD
jgi:hypothetical protein